MLAGCCSRRFGRAPHRAPVAKRHGRLSAACCWMCESRSDAKTRHAPVAKRSGCPRPQAEPRSGRKRPRLGDLRETPRSVPAGGLPQSTVRASPAPSARSARWGIDNRPKDLVQFTATKVERPESPAGGEVSAGGEERSSPSIFMALINR